jgi:hypothetical protein
MATRIIPQQSVTTDDFTGKDLDSGVKPETVTVSVNGKAHKLDGAPESVAAFIAFITDMSDDNRRAFGAIVPRPKVGTSAGGNGSGKDVDSAGISKRDWLRANGYPALGEKGKFGADMNTAWNAHLTAGAPATA